MEFWDIYDDHYLRVKKLVLALLKDEYATDDVCQETFIRVQDHLGELDDPSKVSSWIFRIAYNLCQDHFRRLKSARAIQRANQQGVEMSPASSIHKELEQREMSQCVQDQLSLLPESLRTVIILFDLMGCTHQEVSEVLGITGENVKVRLHRARKKLKVLLEQKCSFDVDERNVLVCEPKSAITVKEQCYDH
jgi:RNA polymerase sigma-70 factor, ECF subfamily